MSSQWLLTTVPRRKREVLDKLAFDNGTTLEQSAQALAARLARSEYQLLPPFDTIVIGAVALAYGCSTTQYVQNASDPSSSPVSGSWPLILA